MKRLLAGGARKSIPSALTVGEISRVTVDPLLMMGMNWFVALLLGTRAGLQFPALFQLLSPSVQTEVITAAEALPTPPSSRAGARTTSSNLLFKSAASACTLDNLHVARNANTGCQLFFMCPPLRKNSNLALISSRKSISP